MHSKILLSTFIGIGENVSERCDIDTRNIIGSKCDSGENNMSEISSNNGSTTEEEETSSSGSEDEFTVPIVKIEKRKHRRVIDTPSIEKKSVFKNKEMSKREMTEYIEKEKEETVEEMLSKNKWIMDRQKRHLVFKRNVLIDGNVVTQTFTMSKTSSDKRAVKNQLKVLVNLNRGIDKIFTTREN